MVRYLFYTIGDLTYQSPLVFRETTAAYHKHYTNLSGKRKSLFTVKASGAHFCD